MYDVLVAGGGGSGLMAAIEAAEQRAKVLLVEKQPTLGGSTGMAIGSVTAAGTALQAAAGIQDSADGHLQDLLKCLPPGNRSEDYDLALSRLMVERAPQAIARLIELGVRFSGPHPEPPHTVYRMHNIVPDTTAAINTLGVAARSRGVTVQTETAIETLHRDDSGVVSRVVLRHGQQYTVHVRRGVVLATGDFSGNRALAHAPGQPLATAAVPPLRPYATGDGITVATAVGAAVAGMESGDAGFRTVSRPYAAPDLQLFVEGTILVNKQGRRFANELQAPEVAASRQAEQAAFAVFDARLAARIATEAEDAAHSRDGWYRRGKLFLSTFPGVAFAYLDDYRQRTDYLFEAADLSMLAERMALPAADFVSEVRKYSRAAAGIVPDRFGRDPLGPGVAVPPFYAIGPMRPVIGASEGGLKVDREMQVLDEAGSVIPRLYAAGVNGEGAAFLGGHGHHLAWAFSTGQIAGTNAARNTPV